MLKGTNSSLLKIQVSIGEVRSNVLLEFSNIFWMKYIQTHTENIVRNNYNYTTTVGMYIYIYICKKQFIYIYVWEPLFVHLWWYRTD